MICIWVCLCCKEYVLDFIVWMIVLDWEVIDKLLKLFLRECWVLKFSLSGKYVIGCGISMDYKVKDKIWFLIWL